MRTSSPLRRFLAALVAAASVATASAQDLSGLVSSGSTEEGFGGVPDYVEVKTWLDRDAYHPGETARIVVEMRIDPKVHLNGHVPTEDYQIPTDLTWSQVPAGVTLSAIEWPKPKMAAFAFTDGKKIAVLEGTQRASLTAKLSPTATGSSTLLGTFRAQGCTHETCYGPQTDAVKITLRVVPAGEDTQAINEDKFPATRAEAAPLEGAAPPGGGSEAVAEEPASPAAEVAADPAPEEISQPTAIAAAPPAARGATPDGDREFVCPVSAGQAALPSDKPLLIVYVLSFLGGLALTLTPCVLPLVPITIGFFSGQRQNGGHPLTLSALYVLGLALVYSVLGTVAALTGSLFGSALQSPIVLVVIAAVLVGLSLSMFGLWNLNLPSAITSRIGGGRSGAAGAAAMGGAMGLIAAPCVGPFVVSLLTYVAALGSRMPTPQAALVGGSLFFVLALGLGTPFFIVGMGVASVRPGGWMVTVKKVFGFLILGVALHFLRPLVGATAFQAGLVLLLAAAAAFLFVHAPESRNVRLRAGVRVLGGLSATAAVIAALLFTGVIPGLGGHAGPAWEHYDETKLTAAAEAGRPVVIDFTAEWCTVCKQLELHVFPDEDVQRHLEDFVLLRADLTEEEPAAQALYDRLGIVGLPSIVFLDSRGREIRDLRLTGFEPPADFVVRLQCVEGYEMARLDSPR